MQQAEAPAAAKGGSVIFSSEGDLGDSLGHLCTIRQLATESDLRLFAAPGVVREPWTPAKVERCRSFLELQPYIRSVAYADRPEGVDLSAWRRQYKRGLNLPDMVCDAFGVPHWPRETPWCVVDRLERVAPVVIHRSPRYHQRGFPWRQVVKKWGKVAVFVGAVEEHTTFTKEFGAVDYHPTPTLLDLARVIAGADLLVANQSAPMMLGESLKVPRWLERCLRSDNCHWERRQAWYGPQFPPEGVVKA